MPLDPSPVASSPVAISHTPLANVLTAWWDASEYVRITPVPPGLSGGGVWRVDRTDSDESFALKSCDRRRASHLAGIDAMIAAAATRCEHLTPVLPTRTGQTGTSSGNHWWRCFRWRCGEPLTNQSNTSTISLGIAALAQAHAAMNEAASASEPSPPRRPNRAWLRHRLERLTAIPTRVLDRSQTSPIAISSAPVPVNRAIADARACLEHATASGELAAIIDQIRRWDAEATSHRDPLAGRDTWTFGDAHPDNVLVDPGSDPMPASSIGLIDHDEARIADPACDLARLVGGMRHDIAEAASAMDMLAWAAAEYRRIRPFSDCQERLAAVWMAAGWIGSLANWVVWVSQENRDFAWPPELLADRIHTLAAQVRQLESNPWRQFDTLRD